MELIWEQKDNTQEKTHFMNLIELDESSWAIFFVLVYVCRTSSLKAWASDRGWAGWEAKEGFCFVWEISLLGAFNVATRLDLREANKSTARRDHIMRMSLFAVLKKMRAKARRPISLFFAMLWAKNFLLWLFISSCTHRGCRWNWDFPSSLLSTTPKRYFATPNRAPSQKLLIRLPFHLYWNCHFVIFDGLLQQNNTISCIKWATVIVSSRNSSLPGRL